MCGGFWCDDEGLGMHHMGADVSRLHRTECSQPHVKGDPGLVYSPFREVLEELIGEMQPCRRSRHSARMGREDGLIRLRVGREGLSLPDVGRQRDLSILV